MGKDIDWEAIKELDLDMSPEAEMRFNAALKRGMRMQITPEEDRLLREWVEKMGW